ncbi:MAG: transposase, partial [Phormidesmis sp. CAN_BIN44]|nr:transposase [Phormidesmis sp. CAN_BIN44]
RLGVYRWLMLSLIAYLLAHWVSRTFPNWWRLDWGEVCVKAVTILLPHVAWIKLLRLIHKHRDLVDEQGFEIIIQSLSSAY